MGAAEHVKGETHAVVQCVVAAGKGLELILTAAVPNGNDPVEFCAEYIGRLIEMEMNGMLAGSGPWISGFSIGSNRLSEF
jgi:hypothetical protein